MFFLFFFLELRSPPNCGYSLFMNTSPINMDQSTIYYQENFDLGVIPSGWVILRSMFSSGAVNPNWRIASNLPSNKPGSALFAATVDSECGTSLEAGRRIIRTPVFTVPNDGNGVYLSFRHWFSLEEGRDGGYVSISVNGGVFQRVGSEGFSLNGYPFSIHSSSSNPIAGSNAFTGSGQYATTSGIWADSEIYVSKYATAGNTVQFNFEIATDSCMGWNGWYIDDVKFYTSPFHEAKICPAISSGYPTGAISDGETPLEYTFDFTSLLPHSFMFLRTEFSGIFEAISPSYQNEIIFNTLSPENHKTTYPLSHLRPLSGQVSVFSSNWTPNLPTSSTIRGVWKVRLSESFNDAGADMAVNNICLSIIYRVPTIYCGNGVCDGNEDCNSCSDCPGIKRQYCCQANGVCVGPKCNSNSCLSSSPSTTSLSSTGSSTTSNIPSTTGSSTTSSIPSTTGSEICVPSNSLCTSSSTLANCNSISCRNSGCTGSGCVFTSQSCTASSTSICTDQKTWKCSSLATCNNNGRCSTNNCAIQN